MKEKVLATACGDIHYWVNAIAEKTRHSWFSCRVLPQIIVCLTSRLSTLRGNILSLSGMHRDMHHPGHFYLISA